MHEVAIGDDIRERLIARRGRFHIYDRFEPARSAFVIIDMQNAFCKPGAPAEVAASRDIVDDINAFNDVLRGHEVEIIWIVTAFDSTNGRSDWENLTGRITAAEVRERTMAYMAPGAEGTLLWEPLKRLDTEMIVIKNRYGCFSAGASPLERILRSRGIDTVFFGGTKTNICCETAARAAFDMDFNVVLVDDCCAALSDREHLAAMENVIQQFGDVMGWREVAERLG